MSKKDEYGLEFLRISTNGKIGYSCRRKNGIVDQNNLLQFLSSLDVKDAEFLLKEINSYLNNSPNPAWTTYHSMVLEHIDLQIDYPNLVVDEQPYTFPLVDIRDLLEEWIDFINQN